MVGWQTKRHLHLINSTASAQIIHKFNPKKTDKKKNTEKIVNEKKRITKSTDRKVRKGGYPHISALSPALPSYPAARNLRGMWEKKKEQHACVKYLHIFNWILIYVIFCCSVFFEVYFYGPRAPQLPKWNLLLWFLMGSCRISFYYRTRYKRV